MRVYETCELTFSGEEPKKSPALAEITARFQVDGRTKVVKGFYAGNGKYKVRFYPTKEGAYTYQITGAAEGSGSFFCEKPITHGMVKTENCHFVYEDGTLFYPFGTTIYALIHQEEELIRQTLNTLKENPFNKVRLCLFPKHCLYNENDPQYYPFEKKSDGSWDVLRPNYDYWEHLEKILMEMGTMGIQCDLILFHPYDC